VPATTLADHWKIYCTGAEEARKTSSDRSVWRVSRSIYIGESTAEAWEFALNSAFARSYDYLIKVLKAANMLHIVKHDLDVPDREVTPEYMMKNNLIIGDVDECTRQLQELWEVTGGFGTLLMISHDWDNKSKWVRSMELLANEVVPMLPTI
jgi:limonene 1,2-monooxygenase